MLIVEVGKKETIDRALKRLKKKYDNSKTGKILRERKEYKKPSVKRRQEIQKAIYVRKKAQEKEND
jgi:small subunit ribosomal protein S21